MSIYTFDGNVVSDLYKDAYGSRPREGFWRHWDESTSDEKQQIWDRLIEAANDEAERERQLQAERVADLEHRFAFMQATIVGCTREDCIRYLHDAYNTNGDVEYLEFCLGVPYGYLSGKNFG